MRYVKKILPLLVLTSINYDAMAVGFGQQTTITGYYVYQSGTAYIKTANNQNPDSCSNTNYLYIDSSTGHFKEIWATIIAAQASGSTVSLYYDGCSPGGTYPKVSAVAVPNIW